MDIGNLTDERLLSLCNHYGERAKFFRQKFIGLLPEVYRRKLYIKKKCGSVFEFAKKLAGLSEEQVRRVLNLDKKLTDKPELHKALTNGEVSMNKLRRIVSIATQGNQKILLEQIKILPQRAVETLVRDMKVLGEESGHVPRSSGDVHGHVPTPEPKLSEEVKGKLYELQKRGIDIDELILDAVIKREKEISEDKEKLSEEQESLTKREQNTSENPSRHIPMKIQKLIQKEYGTKCSIPDCPRKAEEIHHEIPFSILKNHNPYFLKPLCEEHHIIAHRIHAAYEEIRKKASYRS